MTGQEFLDATYLAYRGKTQSRTPAWGVEKANIVIDIGNRKIREWATDPRNKWNSLFEITTVGVINVTTQTYDLDDTFFASSDYAKVIKTDGSSVEYPIVKAQQRNVGGQTTYIHGSDPKKITFSQDIDAGLDGGTLYVAGYLIPTEITAATDIIPVDDPNWLVYITASELARNDPAKDDQFPTLTGMANDAYRKMVDANNDVGFGQPNAIVNFMPNIGQFSEQESWAD